MSYLFSGPAYDTVSYLCAALLLAGLVATVALVILAVIDGDGYSGRRRNTWRGRRAGRDQVSRTATVDIMVCRGARGGDRTGRHHVAA